MTHPFTRRDFLKGTTAVLVGASFGLGQEGATAKKARVVLVRHRDVLDENSAIRPDLLQGMLDGAVTRLLDADDPVKAFGRLIKPGETVGIKTNVWSYLPTPPEL